MLNLNSTIRKQIEPSSALFVAHVCLNVIDRLLTCSLRAEKEVPNPKYKDSQDDGGYGQNPPML
jgi:hypothetical protein